ncbi:MAG: hypothetical protein JNJ98_00225 [Gemmatimonadetes bacterium]|nr:hypothetical protein [Gemmatimonadota bacterium]
MSRPTAIKLALAGVGLALFAAGVRFENDRLRWAAIVAVALAFLMRFFERDRQG